MRNIVDKQLPPEILEDLRSRPRRRMLVYCGLFIVGLAISLAMVGP